MIDSIENRTISKASKISNSPQINSEYDKNAIIINKRSSSMPSLSSLSQLPESYNIPHINENNALDSTFHNLTNLISSKSKIIYEKV